MNKIGIAGFGFVGQAVFSAVSVRGDCVIYDRYKERFSGTLQDLKNADAIFCCLPTPMQEDGTQDFSAYEWFFEQIQGYKGLLIIKSTVLYENVAPYMAEFNIVLNPEFLCQNSAVRDFRNQRLIILGGEVDLCRKAEAVYRHKFTLLPDVEYEYCTAEQACQLKYMHNIYHAYKILFWNYVHEQTDNQRRIFDLYSRITGNTNEMARVAADGKLGYGGACFTKDVAAFDMQHQHPLTRYMRTYNKRLRDE